MINKITRETWKLWRSEIIYIIACDDITPGVAAGEILNYLENEGAFTVVPKFMVVLWDSKEGLLNEDPAHEVVVVEAMDAETALHQVLDDIRPEYKGKVWARTYNEEEYNEQFPRK